jgi:hypothetical protein
MLKNIFIAEGEYANAFESGKNGELVHTKLLNSDRISTPWKIQLDLKIFNLRTLETFHVSEPMTERLP